MPIKGLETDNGNFALIDTLRQWGVTFYAGVTGGGLVHITKYLTPLKSLSDVNNNLPQMLTICEYVAGFVPIGYYLASGRIGVCVATTGAAIKLASCGMSDAKLHNIPAIYIFSLNSASALSKSPLQDVSIYGMNIVSQLQAELGDGCIVIDDINSLEMKLRHAQSVLLQSRPIAIAFHPDILSKKISLHIDKVERPVTYSKKDVNYFLKGISASAANRRIIIYVSSEAARSNGIQELINQFCEILQAPAIWSVNGALAVSPDNPFGYGYISLGGNDKSLELLNSMTEDDILIALGFDAGEYSLTLKKIPAKEVWHFTEFPFAYGHHESSIKHRVTGNYYQVRGNIGLSLTAIIPKLRKLDLNPRPKISFEKNLNTRRISHEVKSGCVDIVNFFESLYALWQPNSIGFDDVCLSYKDRQYVTQRPHPFIKFHTTHDASAMGGAFGLGIGAAIAETKMHIFIFSGDGCWRLYGGALADVAKLNLRLFIINNGAYGLIKQGYKVIIPEVDASRYHASLPPIDFVLAAKSQGWEAYHLKADLSNLKEIMHRCYTQRAQSILINVPVDPDQIVGFNNRLDNLKIRDFL